jgi:enamine deaminase RidA (YjgF/YER057c/UK114 family)
MGIVRHEGSKMFSRAVVNNGVIYFTGHVAKDEYKTLEEQAKALTVRYEELLNQFGSDKEHILMANIYYSELSDENTQIFDKIWLEWLGKENMPSAVGVGVKLAGDRLIEVALIAAQK